MKKFVDTIMRLDGVKKVAMYIVIQDWEWMEDISSTTHWFSYKELSEHPNSIAVANYLNQDN